MKLTKGKIWYFKSISIEGILFLIINSVTPLTSDCKNANLGCQQDSTN